jgi:hypothetical protein
MSKDDPGALNSNFEDQGYGSVYLLQNLGTLLVAILTIPLLVGLYYVLLPFTRCSTKIKKVHLKLKNYLFWSHQIQVIFESYSVICMCALINLKFVSVFVFTFLGIFQYLRSDNKLSSSVFVRTSLCACSFRHCNRNDA